MKPKASNNKHNVAAASCSHVDTKADASNTSSLLSLNFNGRKGCKKNPVVYFIKKEKAHSPIDECNKSSKSFKSQSSTCSSLKEGTKGKRNLTRPHALIPKEESTDVTNIDDFVKPVKRIKSESTVTEKMVVTESVNNCEKEVVDSVPAAHQQLGHNSRFQNCLTPTVKNLCSGIFNIMSASRARQNEPKLTMMPTTTKIFRMQKNFILKQEPSNNFSNERFNVKGSGVISLMEQNTTIDSCHMKQSNSSALSPDVIYLGSKTCSPKNKSLEEKVIRKKQIIGERNSRTGKRELNELYKNLEEITWQNDKDFTTRLIREKDRIRHSGRASNIKAVTADRSMKLAKLHKMQEQTKKVTVNKRPVVVPNKRKSAISFMKKSVQKSTKIVLSKNIANVGQARARNGQYKKVKTADGKTISLSKIKSLSNAKTVNRKNVISSVVPRNKKLVSKTKCPLNILNKSTSHIKTVKDGDVKKYMINKFALSNKIKTKPQSKAKAVSSTSSLTKNLQKEDTVDRKVSPSVSKALNKVIEDDQKIAHLEKIIQEVSEYKRPPIKKIATSTITFKSKSQNKVKGIQNATDFYGSQSTVRLSNVLHNVNTLETMFRDNSDYRCLSALQKGPNLRVPVQPLDPSQLWHVTSSGFHKSVEQEHDDYNRKSLQQVMLRVFAGIDQKHVNSVLREVHGSIGRSSSTNTKNSKKRKHEEESVRCSIRQSECAFRYKEIVVKKHEHYIQVVLVPNPTKQNSLTIEAMKELKEAFQSAGKDINCKAVLLNSSGTYFCSGIDLSQLCGSHKKQIAEEMAKTVRDLVLTLAVFPKPVVAAVNGYAFGLGVAMLTFCDVVLASDKATFCIPSTKFGYIPEGGVILTLPQVVGSSVAMEMLLQGRQLTAQQALKHGLVSEVIWPTTLMEEVSPRMTKLVEQSSQVMEAIKIMVRCHLWDKLAVQLDHERRLLPIQWLSSECQHNIRAHIQRGGF